MVQNKWGWGGTENLTFRYHGIVKSLLSCISSVLIAYESCEILQLKLESIIDGLKGKF